MQELRPGRLGEVGMPPDCRARQGSVWESWVGAAVQQVRREGCPSSSPSRVPIWLRQEEFATFLNPGSGDRRPK